MASIPRANHVDSSRPFSHDFLNNRDMIFPPFSTFAGCRLPFLRVKVVAFPVYVKYSSRFLQAACKPFSGTSKGEKLGFKVIDRS